MTLEFFKTLWGWEGSWRLAMEEAMSAGFVGVEGPLPKLEPALREARSVLADYPDRWIAEVSTTGYAVPRPGASPQEHLDILRREIERSLPLHPRFFTCMAGDDCWPVDQSVEFFGQALDLGRSFGVRLCFETHRGRSLFHPRVTCEILRQLPELELTADFSHWCVACERLVLREYPEFLNICLPRISHLHARVGYDQGAQVPHPQLPRYHDALEEHLRWWGAVLQAQAASGRTRATVTPEAGPDGYQQIEASTDRAYGDLWEINRTVAQLLEDHWCRLIAAGK